MAQACLTLYDPKDVARQAPLSVEFSRLEFWSGLPFPSLNHKVNALVSLGISPCNSRWGRQTGSRWEMMAESDKLEFRLDRLGLVFSEVHGLRPDFSSCVHPPLHPHHSQVLSADRHSVSTRCVPGPLPGCTGTLWMRCRPRLRAVFI